MSDLTADQDELRRLYLEKAALLQANKANVAAQQSIEKSLTALRRCYDELKTILKWLDQADKYDLEDRALDIVRLNDQNEEEMASRAPFTAGMLRGVALTHLQSVERAEFDNLVAASPWAAHEDKAVTMGVAIAARRAIAIELQSDRQYAGDPLVAAAAVTEDEALAYAEPRSIEDTLDRIDWQIVASQLSHRNAEECRTRWIMVCRTGVNISPWKAAEIQSVCDVVQQQGTPIDWEKVKDELGTGRTGYSCFLAYCRSRPFDGTRYSAEDDEQLVTQYELFGGAWRVIALHHFSGRDKAHHYGRYSRTIDPRINKGKWTEEQDERLDKAVSELGSKDWNVVSSRLIGRTGNQCRERWSVLKRRVATTEANKPITWTEEMDRVVLANLTDKWTPKDGMKWANVARLVGPEVREKQVRHRVPTLRRNAEMGAKQDVRRERKELRELDHKARLAAQEAERKRKEEERNLAQKRKEEEKLHAKVKKEEEHKRKREEESLDPAKKQKPVLPCTVQGCKKTFTAEGWRKRHVERDHRPAV